MLQVILPRAKKGTPITAHLLFTQDNVLYSHQYFFIEAKVLRNSCRKHSLPSSEMTE